MYRAAFDEFGRVCVGKILSGVALTATEEQLFEMLLSAREASGERLLGSMAGPDACIDTVSGRCGHRPVFCNVPASIGAEP